MDDRLENLISTFNGKGWKLVGSIEISSDWWFLDIIQLNSTWRPIGTKIYLTLLTDPQILEKKIVWNIGISTTIPDKRIFNFIEQIALNDVKRTNLNLLVEKINLKVLK